VFFCDEPGGGVVGEGLHEPLARLECHQAGVGLAHGGDGGCLCPELRPGGRGLEPLVVDVGRGRAVDDLLEDDLAGVVEVVDLLGAVGAGHGGLAGPVVEVGAGVVFVVVGVGVGVEAAAEFHGGELVELVVVVLVVGVGLEVVGAYTAEIGDAEAGERLVVGFVAEHELHEAVVVAGGGAVVVAEVFGGDLCAGAPGFFDDGLFDVFAGRVSGVGGIGDLAHGGAVDFEGDLLEHPASPLVFVGVLIACVRVLDLDLFDLGVVVVDGRRLPAGAVDGGDFAVAVEAAAPAVGVLELPGVAVGPADLRPHVVAGIPHGAVFLEVVFLPRATIEEHAGPVGDEA